MKMPKLTSRERIAVVFALGVVTNQQFIDAHNKLCPEELFTVDDVNSAYKKITGRDFKTDMSDYLKRN